MHRRFSHVMQDLAIIALSILVALFIVETDTLKNLLTPSRSLEWLGSFIAGMFFTSVLTTAPAIVTLGELAQVEAIWQVALFGALGAVVGDLIIFRFVRDRLSESISDILKEVGWSRRVRRLLKAPAFRWIAFLVGGIIIASPLPDELGISLLGFSRMSLPMFMSISFAFNFVGVYLIGMVARAL